MAHPIHRVHRVEIVGPYVLRVTFADAVERIIDLEPILAGEIYGPLRDPELFSQVRVDPEVHTIVWPNGADFDPATLHDWPEHAAAFARKAEEWARRRQASMSRQCRDMDARYCRRPVRTFAKSKRAPSRELGDFMTFEIGPDDNHPEIQNDGMQYDGLRFRAKCRLAGKLYGQPFGVDVACGDPILGAPEIVVAEDVLAFAGLAPPTLRLYPIETHIAEKFHAYTMPRPRPNARVKDLPDIALLATAQTVDAKRLRNALEQTFTFRKTHPLPVAVPAPLHAWATPYAAMAREDQLLWPTLDEVTTAAQAFLDPVLAGGLDATWEPAGWHWRLHYESPLEASSRRPALPGYITAP